MGEFGGGGRGSVDALLHRSFLAGEGTGDAEAAAMVIEQSGCNGSEEFLADPVIVDAAGSNSEAWTADRTEPERKNVPHHPFKLRIPLPTNLDPAHTRTVAARSTSPTATADRIRHALSDEGYGVVYEAKLLMGHNSKGRSYPRGTDLIVAERGVRVDVTENERGSRQGRWYLGGLAASVVAFAILDLTIPQYWGWTFPVGIAMALFLFLGLSGITTSVFVSDVVVTAIFSATEGSSRVEITGALAQSKNYSSKSGTWREVWRSATSNEVSHSVDALASRVGEETTLPT